MIFFTRVLADEFCNIPKMKLSWLSTVNQMLPIRYHTILCPDGSNRCDDDCFFFLCFSTVCALILISSLGIEIKHSSLRFRIHVIPDTISTTNSPHNMLELKQCLVCWSRHLPTQAILKKHEVMPFQSPSPHFYHATQIKIQARDVYCIFALPKGDGFTVHSASSIHSLPPRWFLTRSLSKVSRSKWISEQSTLN